MLLERKVVFPNFAKEKLWLSLEDFCRLIHVVKCFLVLILDAHAKEVKEASHEVFWCGILPLGVRSHNKPAKPQIQAGLCSAIVTKPALMDAYK